MDSIKEMQQYLDTIEEKKRKGIQVVTREEIGDLYHISRDGKIKEFIPFLTNRASNTEDRSIPRVSTAPSILACFIGYGAALADFDKGNFAEAHGLNDYDKDMGKDLGGWYIYSFNYEAALRPSKHQVFDAPISDEIWLVPYAPEYSKYVPKIVGKVFYHQLNIVKHAKGCQRTVEMFIEVSDRPIKFSHEHTLTKGYWRIVGPEQANVKDYKDTKDFTVQEVSKSEYLSKKKITASLLSREW